jgi:hypothetical protein
MTRLAWFALCLAAASVAFWVPTAASIRGDTLKITLGGNRSKGTLSGTLLFGGSGPLTGTFSC